MPQRNFREQARLGRKMQLAELAEAAGITLPNLSVLKTGNAGKKSRNTSN